LRMASRRPAWLLLHRRVPAAQREDDADMLNSGSLSHAAQLEAGFPGRNTSARMRSDRHRPAQHGSVAVGEADYFETFFAQNTLAHTLRVWAVVSQQDAAQSFSGWPPADEAAGAARAGWCRPVAASSYPSSFLLRLADRPRFWLACDCRGGCAVVAGVARLDWRRVFLPRQ